MVWKRLFRQNTAESPESAPAEEADAPGSGSQPAAQPPIPGAHLAGVTPSSTQTLPPHMQRVVQERRKPATEAGGRSDLRQRLARLQQQRLAILFDVDQGELAEADENPWTHRIALLSEAMEAVTADLASLTKLPPDPSWSVPPVPVNDLVVQSGQPFAVSLRIGNEVFTWEETLDWAERGHQISLPELQRTQGRAEAVLPMETPVTLRDALAAHLSQSLDAFAEDVRERSLNDEPIPTDVTLANLAQPSPKFGGWLDASGRSPVKALRAAEEMTLRRERDRLLTERGREAEERHRLVERLPIARRRLADVDTEIAETEALIAREGVSRPGR